MDDVRSIEPGPEPDGFEPEIEVERPPTLGTDERRMHVRAYNYWVSLLGGRAYPAIEDLDPAKADDFGPHRVLLDFTAGVDNPADRLSRAMRCARSAAGAGDIRTIADVPARSLLSRLTDHYLQIIANRAPIGFEAEFVSQRGHNTLYRGILMPFSSDDETIDFVYGVINWKELAEPDHGRRSGTGDGRRAAGQRRVTADARHAALGRRPARRAGGSARAADLHRAAQR